MVGHKFGITYNFELVGNNIVESNTYQIKIYYVLQLTFIIQFIYFNLMIFLIKLIFIFFYQTWYNSLQPCLYAGQHSLRHTSINELLVCYSHTIVSYNFFILIINVQTSSYLYLLIYVLCDNDWWIFSFTA